jgi:N-carbamoylputrescine amidase
MPNPEKTKVALVQMRCGQEPDANLAHALDSIVDAAKNGAQIVCLPELFRSQYFCNRRTTTTFR